MHARELDAMTTTLLDAWNAHDVERVVACYTEDVRYRDPNTRGFVEGREALRRYLGRLFAEWRMSWHRREAFPLASTEGVAFLWRATFQRRDGGPTVEADGMDLALVEGSRLCRNDVYFDRAALAPLLPR